MAASYHRWPTWSACRWRCHLAQRKTLAISQSFDCKVDKPNGSLERVVNFWWPILVSWNLTDTPRLARAVKIEDPDILQAISGFNYAVVTSIQYSRWDSRVTKFCYSSTQCGPSSALKNEFGTEWPPEGFVLTQPTRQVVELKRDYFRSALTRDSTLNAASNPRNLIALRYRWC